MTDTLDRLKTALQDRYTIEREIGRGGMATVYLAEDLKHHRKVAVKVLRPELAAALGAERFQQEIKIAANLNHPHILPLLDSGESDGFLFFVMPYMEGESLRDKLAHEGELPIVDAVRILREVVDALAHAHAHGVVHRDIKPDNVMLSGRHALVTDFGVAKAVSEATGRQQLTTEGVALGTPTYMAPEQAAADPHIDHRADIYAVGVVAYELLTGRPPFMGTTPQMILSAHLTDTPDPVTKYRESVPPALAALVMKCLEKKAADRWQTAEELLPQLEALATTSGGTTPVGTVPISAVARSKKMAIGASALAIILAAILVVTLLPRGSSMALDPDHVAVAVFRNATGDPTLDQLGERVGHWITQGIQQAAIPVTPWDLAIQSSEYVQAEATAGRVRDVVRAFAEETGAGTIISGTVYLEGDTLEVQANVTDAVHGRLLGSLAPVAGRREAQRDVIGRVQQQVIVLLSVNFDETLRGLAPDLGSDIPSFEAYQAFSEGMRLHLQFRGAEAIPHLKRASELDSTWAQPLIRLMVSAANTGQRVLRDSALGVLEALGNKLSPYDRAEVEHWRARVSNDYERALSAGRRLMELAPGSPAVWNFSQIANQRNRPREALDALETINPERGWVREWPQYWFMLMLAHFMMGEHQRAIEPAVRCHERHADNPWCLVFHANALAVLGREEELYDVLDSVRSSALPELVMHVLPFVRNYGPADAVKRVADGAVKWFEARPPNEITRLNNRHEYGRALFFAGRTAAAQSVFDAIVADFPDDAINRTHRAFLAAMRGDSTQAVSDAEYLEVQAEQLEGLDAHEARWWGRGIVYAALGYRARAMELLSEFEPWFDFTSVYWGIELYDPLRDYPPFQEFIRPKG